MASLSYEARKRIFNSPLPLDIVYRCRSCGHDQTLSIPEVTQHNYVFKCSAGYCKVEWKPERYNVVWRVLVAKGCSPAPYKEHLRYNQLKHYISYHS